MKHKRKEIITPTRDWYCRNCQTRFVPIFWVSAGGGELVGQCIICGSNATEQYINQKEESRSSHEDV